MAKRLAIVKCLLQEKRKRLDQPRQVEATSFR